MKKLVNDPEDVVDEMLDGLVAERPDALRRVPDSNIIVREDAPVENKVAVTSGGGSGHEPAFAGYIGEGFLDGAASGEVFTSPTPDMFETLVESVDAGAGVVVIINNYEGDIMNLETAVEMIEMETDTAIETVIVDDDVAVEDSEYTTGRRGVAGATFALKVAGAKAAEGADLETVAETTRAAIDRIGTMSMALTPCVTPEKGEPTFTLGDDEMEIGIGLHGEPGVERTEIASADEITDRLVDGVLEDLDPSGEVATIVNGTGGTPLMELYVVNRRLQERLDDAGLDHWDALVGEYMTSLDMCGCSVTVMDVNEEFKRLLSAPADSPGMTVPE
ncbi:dihydroxyacetone kinase subunit DhaK [Halohasta litorea]|uniref:Dihydroxyacetone kinase subunit DhaK n=1 Tax=Halohasta litorea TaxID=869891 RepID=A0ABD6DA17_9EURY|nr:dihydroxyacetone kinase subunit DhaK [Halohasta litorea]